MKRVALALFALIFVACSGGDESSPGEVVNVPEPSDPWEAGPFAPGHVTTELTDTTRERTFTVEVWYPSAAEAPTAESLSIFEPVSERAAVEAQLAAATAGCPTETTNAARDAEVFPGLGPRPMVLFSHCMNCGRYSSFSIAERLASHGFVVVAPDHAGPRPYVDGATGEQLSPAQLETRVADATIVLDAALDGGLFAGISQLDGVSIDPESVGMMGHSFGSVTTGFVAQNDGRISAAVGLAAPMANPLFPGVEMADIDVPLFLVLAEEDNSIMEVGNRFLRQNFEDANSPVWRLDLADAGHWSVSDLAGIRSAFEAGCGEGTRHSEGREGEAFTYIPVADGIATTSSYVTTFFLAQLTDHPQGAERLQNLPGGEGLTLHTR